MDPDDKVFKCQNPECLKETCRYCKEDWTEHFGIPCSEIEKKDETKIRLALYVLITESLFDILLYPLRFHLNVLPFHIHKYKMNTVDQLHVIFCGSSNAKHFAIWVPFG